MLLVLLRGVCFGERAGGFSVFTDSFEFLASISLFSSTGSTYLYMTDIGRIILSFSYIFVKGFCDGTCASRIRLSVC